MMTTEILMSPSLNFPCLRERELPSLLAGWLMQQRHPSSTSSHQSDPVSCFFLASLVDSPYFSFTGPVTENVWNLAGRPAASFDSLYLVVVSILLLTRHDKKQETTSTLYLTMAVSAFLPSEFVCSFR
jgi:hypothetical protein